MLPTSETLICDSLPIAAIKPAFVALPTLQQYATSISDEPSAESLVQAENHLREAISILDTLPEQSLERTKMRGHENENTVPVGLDRSGIESACCCC